MRTNLLKVVAHQGFRLSFVAAGLALATLGVMTACTSDDATADGKASVEAGPGTGTDGGDSSNCPTPEGA